MSSFLLKETNYTKRGKTVKGKSWNSYQQMLKTIKHSLRLENTKENLHIISSKSKNNIVISLTDETLLYDYIQNKISANIIDSENINIEDDQRKKLFKDFSNVKSAISKKIPLDILDEELKSSSDEKEILKNIVYTHKVSNIKAKDKRTLKTIKRYIQLKQQYDLEKQHKKYNNQVLLKEVLFKIPQNQSLNLNDEQWKTIIDKFKNKYFSEYEMFFACIHNDEGSEEKTKGHVHLFLSGFNTDKKEFDIKRNLFNKITAKNNLDLDYNNKENHKKVMNLFQKDFYEFFNTELSNMSIKERINLNEYKSIEDLNKRLQINNEDYLTINEKHQKLANKIIKDKLLELDKNNKYKEIQFKLSENTFSNSLSIKTNLQNNGKNNRVKIFSKILNIGQHFTAYVKKLTDKIKELKNIIINKDKKIEELKQEVITTKEDSQTKNLNFQFKFKKPFEEQKELEIKNIIDENKKIIYSKNKEISTLSSSNNLLEGYKSKYKRFEQTFNVSISKELKKTMHKSKKKVDYEIAV